MSTFKPPVSVERKAFEQWYMRSHTGAHTGRTAKGYIDNTTRVAWRAWQARAGLQVDADESGASQFARMAHNAPTGEVHPILKASNDL